MRVVADKSKAKKLLHERGISLEEIADLLMNHQYIEILEHPRRPEQMIFVMSYRHYTHVVPFVIDVHGAIVLKTAYPSRKHHKRFGGAPNEGDT